MKDAMDFKQWAEKWWRENDKMKSEVTASDIDFLGWRLRKAIDAVFGFEDCEKVESMYDYIEIKDIFPNMIVPSDQEDEKNNRAVLALVEKIIRYEEKKKEIPEEEIPEEEMPEEEMPEKEIPLYTRNKISRIDTLMEKNKATANHLAKLEKAAKNDVRASEKRNRANITIETREKEIENLIAKLEKTPFGTEPMFEVVGEMEGELYDFLLKKVGRGGSVTPYSYADLQRGYWEKVDIEDRCELYRLVRELCEKKGWHIVFGFGDRLNNQFDLEKFSKKIYLPQIYRCQEKADVLSSRFTDFTDIELLEGNDQFLGELEIFKDIDKQLDKLLEKTEAIHTTFIKKYLESKTEEFDSKK